jgi:transposase
MIQDHEQRRAFFAQMDTLLQEGRFASDVAKSLKVSRSTVRRRKRLLRTTEQSAA